MVENLGLRGEREDERERESERASKIENDRARENERAREREGGIERERESGSGLRGQGSTKQLSRKGVRKASRAKAFQNEVVGKWQNGESSLINSATSGRTSAAASERNCNTLKRFKALKTRP